jgi:hypothetical protein
VPRAGGDGVRLEGYETQWTCTGGLGRENLGENVVNGGKTAGVMREGKEGKSLLIRALRLGRDYEVGTR